MASLNNIYSESIFHFPFRSSTISFAISLCTLEVGWIWSYQMDPFIFSRSSSSSPYFAGSSNILLNRPWEDHTNAVASGWTVVNWAALFRRVWFQWAIMVRDNFDRASSKDPIWMKWILVWSKTKKRNEYTYILGSDASVEYPQKGSYVHLLRIIFHIARRGLSEILQHLLLSCVFCATRR